MGRLGNLSKENPKTKKPPDIDVQTQEDVK